MNENTNDSTTKSMIVYERSNPSAWTSFILGVIGSLAWIIPIIGLPITIAGIVLGGVGMKKQYAKGISIAGLVINIVFLLATIAKGTLDIIAYFRHRL